MSVTRHPQGIQICDIVGEHLVSELYIGYTVREAKRLFKNKHGQ
jgi:hypothetical protein